MSATRFAGGRGGRNHLEHEDRPVRVVDAATSRLLRELRIDPGRDYQPQKQTKGEPST